MKKKSIKLLLLFIVLFTVSFSASSQVYVKIRPVVPIVVRPAQPSRDQVWINEEWEPNGGEYRYVGGHWASPPHQGYRRRSGHWQHSRHGEMWVQGGWRRH
jgi:hypothetical protein